MKRICIVMVVLIMVVIEGCGNNKAEDKGTTSGNDTEPKVIKAGALSVPVVKDGVMRPGEDCVEVYFEWDLVEGADGYEVSEENKYYSEKNYREPEVVETMDNFYVATAQDYFDFRIKVRAFKGDEADRTYSEWSSSAIGSAYETETISVGGPYGEISIVIPESWSAETSTIDDGKLTNGLYGLILKPKFADEGWIELFFSDNFGVCGTGLSEEETVLAGCTAHIGTFDDHKYWDFITIGTEQPQIVAMSINCDFWTSSMWDEALTILDTLKFDTSKAEG